MKSAKITSLSIVFLLLMSLANIHAQNETSTPTPTVTSTSDFTLYTIFPHGLDCSTMPDEISLGANWHEITIGVSTIEDIEQQYGEADQFHDMYRIIGDNFIIRFCANDNIITALDVNSDIQQFEDLLRIHGEPDALANDITADIVIAFWFEEGLATSIWINTSSEEYFGRIGSMIFFPYQEIDGYETRWPYASTAATLGYAERTQEPDPFDYSELWATLTLEPTFTPSPTYEATVSETNSNAITSTPTPSQ